MQQALRDLEREESAMSAGAGVRAVPGGVHTLVIGAGQAGLATSPAPATSIPDLEGG
jgi:hypothetical protein